MSHVDEDGDSVHPRKVYFLNFKHTENSAEMLVLRIADYVSDVSAVLCADYLSTGTPTAEDAVKKYLPPGLHNHLRNKFNKRPPPPAAPNQSPQTSTIPGVPSPWPSTSEQWTEVD